MDKPWVNLVCRYSVCAGHRLRRDDWSEAKNREVFGKCVGPHGHEYGIEVVLTGPLSSDTGMLINSFTVDETVRGRVVDQLDHRFLNDDVPFFKEHQPTAEWIAVWIYRELSHAFPVGVVLERVRVFETPTLCAEYPHDSARSPRLA